MPRGIPLSGEYKRKDIPTDEAILALADALAYYDETDVARWFERNKRLTGRYPAVWPATIEDVQAFRQVPNEPFREAWLRLNCPMVMGQPLNVEGSHEGLHDTEPEWCGLFRDELARVIALPEALDSPKKKFGPSDLRYAKIAGYLREALGIKVSKKDGKNSLSWLIDYEVAEVLCKTLGLTPIHVGI